MWIKIEGHRIVNLDLVEIMELHHTRKTATVWNCGVNVAADSHVLYRYFTEMLAPADVVNLPEEKIQAGQSAA